MSDEMCKLTPVRQNGGFSFLTAPKNQKRLSRTNVSNFEAVTKSNDGKNGGAIRSRKSAPLRLHQTYGLIIPFSPTQSV